MNIQPLYHSDISSLLELIPPGWDTALPAIESYTNSNFCYPIKVSLDNKIAGTGTTIIHNDTAWLAHIIVHPGYRNQGLGKKITQSLLETAYSNKCETIYLLATELGAPVYKKLGFETETEYLLFKGESTTGPIKKSPDIVPYTSKFKDEIFNLDRQTSGEDRRIHLEQHLSEGFVYFQDNEVNGFYLPGLGDGLIIANTNEAGIELIKVRLYTKDFAVFPIDNLLASACMKIHNFKQERTQKRMRLGKKRNWIPSNIYNRIGGNLG